jgi:hypothetical protein
MNGISVQRWARRILWNFSKGIGSKQMESFPKAETDHGNDSSFFDRDDFKDIAEAGLNAVRIVRCRIPSVDRVLKLDAILA